MLPPLPLSVDSAARGTRALCDPEARLILDDPVARHSQHKRHNVEMESMHTQHAPPLCAAFTLCWQCPSAPATSARPTPLPHACPPWRPNGLALVERVPTEPNDRAPCPAAARTCLGDGTSNIHAPTRHDWHACRTSRPVVPRRTPQAARHTTEAHCLSARAPQHLIATAAPSRGRPCQAA